MDGANNQLPSMNDQPSGTLFSEQLALQIAALVQEVAAEYEKQLQRQILAERKIAAALRDEVQQLRKWGTAHSSSDAAACPITVKKELSPFPPVISGDLDWPRLQYPITTEDGTWLHHDAPHSDPSNVTVPSRQSEVSMKVGLGEESIKLAESVRTTFRQLDKRNVGRLCANDLKGLVQRHRLEDAHALEDRISRTIEAVNRAQPELCSDLTHVCELSYNGYKYILSARDLDENNFSHEISRTFRNLREGCLNSTTEQMVANEMDLMRQETFRNRKIVWVQDNFLSPLSGVVITVNALCIGLSLDIESQWIGWHIMEVCFAVFFFFELLATVLLNGFIEVYFGDDWRWNLFDTIVVLFALVDAFLWVLDRLGAISEALGDSLGTVSILRLARLVRVTRVMRLLKMNLALFKDLKIMMNGIQGGLNTLFWASVLLFGMIYTVGIIIRMLMQNLNLVCTLDNSSCSPSERALVKNYNTLFASTPRCMFTVFRCLTDGCSAADGTPLVLYFWDWQGILFIICYAVLVVFVFFVVFNLISALFVEKTLEYTKQDTDKRRHARYKEDCRVARELKEVILKICAHKKRRRSAASRLTTGQSNATLVMKALGLRRSSCRFAEEDLDLNDLRLSISKSEFQTIFEEREIKSLLRDLDISMTNFSKLFDILDANQDSKVDIGELADGFLRLRGPADKGDTVRINLMVKSIQKSMTQLQAGQEELRQFVFQTLGR